MANHEIEWVPIDMPSFPTLPPLDITHKIIPTDRLRIKGVVVEKKWHGPAIRFRPYTDDMSQMVADLRIDPVGYTGLDFRRHLRTVVVDMARDIDRTAMFVISGRR